jgi:hypothetical protein
MNKILYLNIDSFQQFLESNRFGIFICSSSFEDRCKKIPMLVGNHSKQTLICHYKDNYVSANNHFAELLCYFKNPKQIFLDRKNPLVNIDLISNELKSIFSKKNRNKKILVDITTLTREMIFILIYYFKNVPPVNKFNVTFVYNPAEKYAIDTKDYSEKWLSRGVRDIRSVLGYSGLFLPDKKLALILLVGFEHERAKKIIDNFEPSKVFIGHASVEGAISKELQAINKKVFEDLKNMLSIEMTQFEFSCKTPNETKDKVDDIIGSIKSEYNIVIASLNNKISTIGVAFSAMENPEVQVCYPTVNQYNIENYSTSKDEIYLIDIN